MLSAPLGGYLIYCYHVEQWYAKSQILIRGGWRSGRLLVRSCSSNAARFPFQAGGEGADLDLKSFAESGEVAPVCTIKRSTSLFCLL